MARKIKGPRRTIIHGPPTSLALDSNPRFPLRHAVEPYFSFHPSPRLFPEHRRGGGLPSDLHFRNPAPIPKGIDGNGPAGQEPSRHAGAPDPGVESSLTTGDGDHQRQPTPPASNPRHPIIAASPPPPTQGQPATLGNLGFRVRHEITWVNLQDVRSDVHPSLRRSSLRSADRTRTRNARAGRRRGGFSEDAQAIGDGPFQAIARSVLHLSIIPHRR